MTVNDDSCKYKNVDTTDSDVLLFILYAYLYVDGWFFHINCLHLSVNMSD